jgi:hypothetical protein
MPSQLHPRLPSGPILPNGVLSLGFSTKSAYPSNAAAIILTTSKIWEPLNVSAQSRTTAAASCLSLVLSLDAMSIADGCPLDGPDRDGSIGTANSVSSSIRRTVSRRFFSSGVTCGSFGVMEDRVSSHFESNIAHSKLQTVR